MRRIIAARLKDWFAALVMAAPSMAAQGCIERTARELHA